MVKLVPMTPVEFNNYIEIAIREYAEEHVQAGNWSEARSLEASRAEFSALLPDGVASTGQYLFTIVDDSTGAVVGMIWYADRPRAGRPAAFVYDFRIDEKFRRQGYATWAMYALDEILKARGINQVSLHVFGNNRAAWALYEKVGYQVSDLLMVKQLDKS